jgi:dTDP-4-amino-4,6-dideoxygalactose transaminase
LGWAGFAGFSAHDFGFLLLFRSQEMTKARKNEGAACEQIRQFFKDMSTTTIPSTQEALALHGGERAVAAQPPASWLHGPQEIGEEEIRAVTNALRNQNLFRFGRERNTSTVAQLEDLFAEKAGGGHVLAVNSGTSALICGLVGIGVSQGDEVLVPAYTYIATAAAVLALGAFPVLVEVDSSLTMDPLDLEKKITPRSKAVAPVHMKGIPCNMEAILAVARKHGLKVIEDCAQANGATYRGKSVGRWGDVGAFSMQHFKVITAGEGGLVISDDKRTYERAAIYHDSALAFWLERQPDGEEIKNLSFLGENYRQSEVHGAIGLEQLKKRDRILGRTRAIKKKLWAAAETLPDVIMETRHDAEGDCGITMTLFAGSVETAKSLGQALKAEGVQCGTRLSKDIPDRHIFYHWNYIMEKRSPHLNGFPWTCLERPCQIEYSREMCPQSMDWLSRSVLFPITQAMSDEYVDQCCLAIEKVGRHFRAA